jgi:MacB-like periplasmic core domain
VWIENFVQDVRFGLRTLRRSPGFTILAFLCLTLGIGANAAVFSWVEGILIRPYPLVSHQERLVALAGTMGSERDETSRPDLLDVQRTCTLCEALFVSNITGASLSIGDRAQTLTGSIVSANYFDAIGVRPILGRGFEPVEDTGPSNFSQGERCDPRLLSLRGQRGNFGLRMAYRPATSIAVQVKLIRISARPWDRAARRAVPE